MVPVKQSTYLFSLELSKVLIFLAEIAIVPYFVNVQSLMCCGLVSMKDVISSKEQGIAKKLTKKITRITMKISNTRAQIAQDPGHPDLLE